MHVQQRVASRPEGPVLGLWEDVGAVGEIPGRQKEQVLHTERPSVRVEIRAV